MALPVLAPKQDTWVWVITVVESGAPGWVIVIVREVVQPFASEMEQTQVPTPRLVAAAVVCTGVVFQLKVYGEVPPLTLIVALPFVAPKQDAFVWVLMLVESPAVGWVIATLRVVEQPFTSVTEQIHVPAESPVAVAEDCAGVVFQLKVYGPVPPDTAMVALPVAPPKHKTLVCAFTLVPRATFGWVMTTL